MTAEPTYAPGGPPRLVGQVFTDLIIRNYRDVVAAEERGNGLGVREIVLDNVLVDTGASHLCLPPYLLEELGLTVRREIVVETAAGPRQTRLFGPAELTVHDRTTVVFIVELPGGAEPLLGVVPMEDLGLEPDLRKQRLRLLPESTAGSHFTAY